MAASGGGGGAVPSAKRFKPCPPIREFTLNERVNTKRLKTIIDGWPTYKDRLNPADYQEFHEIPRRLLAYYQRIRAKDGVLEITYRGTKSNPEGRVYANQMSLQNMPRPIRQTIAREMWYDLDIVNAQPTIVYQLFKDKFALPSLGLYTESQQSREVLLQELRTSIADVCPSKTPAQVQHLAKMMPLQLLNGGFGGQLWQELAMRGKLPAWLQLYAEDCNLILDWVGENHSALMQKIKKDRREKNLPVFSDKGAALHHLYEISEAKILQHMDEIFREWKWIQNNEAASIHDGMMLRKRYVDPNRTPQQNLEVLSAKLKEKSDLEVVVVMKPFLEYWMDVTEAYEKPEMRFITDLHIEASEHLEREVGGRVVKDGNSFFFKKDDGLWTPDRKEIVDKLTIITQGLGLYTLGQGKDPKPVPFTADAFKAESTVKTFLRKVPETPGFYNKLVRGPVYRVCMKNGYWDASVNPARFVYGEDLPGIFSMVRVDRDYTEPNVETMQAVKDRLLIPILGPEDGEVYRAFMHVTARALFGVRGKYSVTFVGFRSAGKSMLFDALRKAMGGYAIMFEPDILLGSHDTGDAQRNSVVFLKAERARCAFSDEIKTKLNDDMNAKLVKAWQAISMTIEARQIMRDAREIVNHSLLYINGNQLPPMKDAAEFNIPLQAPTTFVTKAQKAARQWDDTIKEKDDSIVLFIDEPANQDALLHLLFAYFEEVKDQEFEFEDYPAIQKWRDAEASEGVVKTWHDFYEVTLNEDDTIDCSKITQTFKNFYIEMSHMKLEREMARVFSDMTHTIKTSFKKQKGDDRRYVFTHLKKKEMTEDD